MADDMEDKLELERMPGADALEERDEGFNLNFGLDEADDEPVAEAPEEVEEEVEETTAEVEEAEEEVEEVAEQPEEEVAELEEEPVPEPKPKAKGQTVPKSRMDEVIAERNELRREMEALKEAQKPAAPAAPAYDFEGKEKQYQELILDGEAEKATALRTEINQKTRETLSAELAQEVETTITRKNEETALQLAADQLQSDFPQFNEDSSDYNEALTQEVIDLRDAFIIKGERPVDALAKASDFVIRNHDLSAPAPEEETSTGLAGKAAPAKKNVDEVSKKRAEVAKKLDAASKQPPELPGESSSSHGEKAVDISTLSEEEFNALPEATLKRLRGDIF
jgi:hypothetical protein